MHGLKEKISELDGELAESFVGKGYASYRKSWDRMASKDLFIGWNWWALLFGPVWMAYRKMYLYMIVMMAFAEIISMGFEHFGMVFPGIVFPIMLAILGNYLYFVFVNNKIFALKRKFVDRDSLKGAAIKLGGVNVYAAIFVAIVQAAVFLYLFLTAYPEFIPQLQFIK